MKLQATVLISLQAKTFEEAGAILDDVLARARERQDVEVGRVEVASPPGDTMVTLPALSGRAAGGAPAAAGNGA